VTRWRLSDGVELDCFDSAVDRSAYRLALPNGRAFRVSAETRDLVTLLDGTRSVEDVARDLGAKHGIAYDPEGIGVFIGQVLAPRDIVADGEGTAQSPPRRPPRTRNPLFFFRIDLLQPDQVARLSACTKWLIHPAAALVLVPAIVLIHGLFYAGQLRPLPGLDLAASHLIPVYALVLLSVLIHELGHASATRYWRCEHGAIGFGMYLLFPAFYTDVSEIWKLSRRRRMVVDISGVYFQLVCAGAFILGYWRTGTEAFGVAARIIGLLVLVSLNPVFKFDGYWLLCDLLGVPDLHDRLRALNAGIARRLLGRRGGDDFRRDIKKPAVAHVLILYAVAADLFYLGVIRWLVTALPGFLRTYPALILRTVGSISAALLTGHLGRALSDLLLLLMSSNLLLFLVFGLRNWVRRLRASEDG
jgi:putative peptide zinc metalloprotease protein